MNKTIGVFELGRVPDALADSYADYASMIIDWLRPALPEVDYQPIALVRDTPLPPVTACDAYVYSGSRHGVYDDLPWLGLLEGFIRQAAACARPQFGICFGHQIIAQALGGQAESFSGGWSCGVQLYELELDNGPAQLPVYVMHQDQITAMPPAARNIGHSAQCAIGALDYEAPIRSIQFHPEFSAAYVSDLLRLRGGTAIPTAVAAAAARSLDSAVDNTLIARWAAEFFRAHLELTGV
ncbi:MAG: type 1 glutamine amidotransferase [Gammaproteobacteria bacterium]